MYRYSIIIPAYNCENTIERAIDSVIAQTYSNWELIVVNDGSSDGTVTRVTSFSDERIIVINQENVGPGKARNVGVSNAKGDYIVFLDSDDYYEPTFLKCIEDINEEKARDIVFVDFVLESISGKVKDKSSIYTFRNYKKNELISKQLTGLLPWGPTVKAVSSQIAKKYLFDDYEVGEELIYSFDVLYESQSIGFVEKPQYHYVYNIKGQHTKGGLDPWKNVVDGIAKHLQEKDLLDLYNRNINGLALKSLCINAYRCSCTYSFFNAICAINESYLRYNNEYDLDDCDKESIDTASIVLLFFMKHHLNFVVWFLSVIRKFTN